MDTTPRPDPVDDGNDHRASTESGQPADAGDGAGGADTADVGADDEIGGAEGEHPEGKDPLRFNNWMKRSATGAVLTGITIGLQQALEVPRKQPAFVIEASDDLDDPDRPIDLRFDPDSPADTVAIIRRPHGEPGPGATPPG